VPIAQDAHAKQDAIKPYPNLKYHYDITIEAMNSIFVLKPILDLIYEDAKKDKEEIETLKKRIKELEGLIKIQPVVVQNQVQEVLPNVLPKAIQESEIDDSQYASEASLPATSAPVSVKNEVEDETKTVKMINNMSKKEYMKEYQKNYRKKQKESKEIVMNV
jgi:hypothetical protein